MVRFSKIVVYNEDSENQYTVNYYLSRNHCCKTVEWSRLYFRKRTGNWPFRIVL